MKRSLLLPHPADEHLLAGPSLRSAHAADKRQLHDHRILALDLGMRANAEIPSTGITTFADRLPTRRATVIDRVSALRAD